MGTNNRLNAPGAFAGFLARLLAVTANPKASLFYFAFLPTLFELEQIKSIDITIICVVSLLVPLLCNIVLATRVDRTRRFLKSPKAVRPTNIVAGSSLIAVSFALLYLSYKLVMQVQMRDTPH